MPFVTSDQIISRAATMADMRDNFVTQEEWYDWFNFENRALALFMARHGWRLVDLKSKTAVAPSSLIIDVVAGDRSVMAVLGVWEVASDGRVRRLLYTDRVSAENFAGNTGTARYWSTSESVESEDESVLITLHPTPTSGTYKVVYLPAPQLAVPGEGYGLIYPMGVEEWVVLQLATRAKIKEQTGTDELEKQLRKVEAHVEEVSWNRALAEAPKVRNVDRDERGWSDSMVFSPVDSWIWM